MNYRAHARRQRRIVKLGARIASSVDDHMPVCTIHDAVTLRTCGRPTARAAKTGLSAFVCRYHQQHKQRHGSYWCKSPTATALRPYLLATRAYLKCHTTDPFISAALGGLDSLMQTAGRTEPTTRLRGLPPRRRAQIALARLREADVAPERLLAISLSVAALIEDVPETVHRVEEYQVVAVAKAAHRLASGTHRHWELAQLDGSVKHIHMHTYARSQGRVLRYLGELIEKHCQLVIDHHLTPMLEFKTNREARHAPSGRAP